MPNPPAGARPLAGTRVVSLAGNVPGPVALARRRDLRAAAIKVEPPAGDPFADAAPAWFAELGLAAPSRETLDAAFRARTADAWEAWAAERELPVVAVRTAAR